MATATRQPFAPVDGSRLQALASLKNRHNSPSPLAPAGKRKAERLDVDSENVDPLLAKRAKGLKSSPFSADSTKKSSAFVLTKPATTPRHQDRLDISPAKPATTPRRVLNPKVPAPRTHSGIVKSCPASAPAGRSPTRSKRSGILSGHRRASGSFTRIDPPTFNLDAAAAPFSLDAALKGTFAPRGICPPKANHGALACSLGSLGQADMKADWFFDIHEDTPEQELTNLLQHSTCVLDISSDDNSELRAKRDLEEGRDKENAPPADDVSQAPARRVRRTRADDMQMDKERVALGEMKTADFYASGCDETSVVIVPGDEEDEGEAVSEHSTPCPGSVKSTVDDAAITSMNGGSSSLLPIGRSSPPKAPVLQPIDGADETFELWESGSAKDDSEVPARALASVTEE